MIVVRYPDLVHIDSGEVSHGMFFSADPRQAGGFLPIVWDVPGTDMEAADAIKVVTGYLLEKCENHARKMRTFFTRRLEPKTKSSNAFKWSLRPKRK